MHIVGTRKSKGGKEGILGKEVRERTEGTPLFHADTGEEAAGIAVKDYRRKGGRTERTTVWYHPALNAAGFKASKSPKKRQKGNHEINRKSSKGGDLGGLKRFKT